MSCLGIMSLWENGLSRDDNELNLFLSSGVWCSSGLGRRILNKKEKSYKDDTYSVVPYSVVAIKLCGCSKDKTNNYVVPSGLS